MRQSINRAGAEGTLRQVPVVVGGMCATATDPVQWPGRDVVSFTGGALDGEPLGGLGAWVAAGSLASRRWPL